MSYYPHRQGTLAAVPSGDAGTRATLAAMVKLVRQWRKDPGIWQLSRELTQTVPAKDFSGEVERLFSWVKGHIRYTRDVNEVETLATPKATLDVRAGDCDDMAVLLASLLESVGHPTRFIALAFDNGPFSHVLTETRTSSASWLPLDPTVAQATVGWRPSDATRVMVMHI